MMVVWLDESSELTKTQEEYLMKKKTNVTHLSEKLSHKLLITHNDLDGVGCAIIFAKCYPNAPILFTGYDNVNEQVTKLLLEDKDWDILISDISVDPRVASLLDSRGKVGLLDHHHTAQWLADKYSWATIDNSRCGTHMVYDMLSQYFHLSDLEKFVDTVEDWDLWGATKGNDIPGAEAIRMNFLLSFLGLSRFMKMMLTTGITKKEEEISDILIEKFHDYFDETVERLQINHKDGYTVGICVADQYVSLLGNRIINEMDLEYVMILDPRRGMGSLRGKGNIDLGELAKQAGGGGHRLAAGFPLGEGASNLVSHIESEE